MKVISSLMTDLGLIYPIGLLLIWLMYCKAVRGTDFANNSGQQTAGILCIVSNYKELVIELREQG